MDKVLIANQREVTQLLPMAECIAVMTETFKALAAGQAVLPLRTMMLLPGGDNLIGLMPSYMANIQSVGVKVIAAFPSNFGSEYDTHQGVVILFDAKYGVLRAILDGTSITAIRTAAVSGVATGLLAQEEAGDLALLGAGTQAHTHLEAMKCVRKLRRVRVYSLPLDGAYAFAARESKRHAIQVEVKETAHQAVEGADIICTTTTAREPVLKGEWVAPGAHINAVGAFTPTTRELDSQAVAQARLYVDRRESTLNEAGEFLIPKAEGLFGDEHIVGELGELLTGKAIGRRSPTEITLFSHWGSPSKTWQPPTMCSKKPTRPTWVFGWKSAANTLATPEIGKLDANDLAAQFIASVAWESLPDAVHEKALLCLVDNLGTMLAGTLTRISQIGAQYAAITWPGDQATIVLHAKRASAIGAAFANGCAANAIDIDDSARYAYGHAGAQIFTTALAVAEARSLSGAQLLTGMVVGYEIAHRVGRCWHTSRPDYQACGSWGSVACAAVAAHLMNLSAEQAWQALGIAEYHAPNLPMMRDIDHPAMVKHGIEWAAMTGIISAELAACGFSGIPGILSFEEYQAWGQDIGQNYLMVDGVAWKAARYACCGWAQGGVEGARRLVLENGIDLNAIAHIRVEGCHGSYRLGTRLPATMEQAQFNQAWPLAAMLVDGEIGPAQMLESRLSDPQIRALAQKVEVVETEEMETLRRLFEQGDPRGRFASQVTITLNDGRSFHSGLVDSGLRFPPIGWDRDRMSDKFRWLAGFVLSSAQIDEILETLWRFAQVSNVHDLTRLLQ